MRAQKALLPVDGCIVLQNLFSRPLYISVKYLARGASSFKRARSDLGNAFILVEVHRCWGQLKNCLCAVQLNIQFVSAECTTVRAFSRNI